MIFFLLIFLPNTVSRIGFKFQLCTPFKIHSLEPTCCRKSRYLVCESFLRDTERIKQLFSPLCIISKTSLVRTYYRHPERAFFENSKLLGLDRQIVWGIWGILWKISTQNCSLNLYHSFVSVKKAKHISKWKLIK